MELPEDKVLGAVPDLEIITDTPEQGGAASETPPADKAPVEKPSSEYIPNPLWGVIAQRLSTETSPYELPEPIKVGKVGETPLTPEQEFEYFARTIQENTRIPELEDPFVKEYIASKRGDNFNLDSFIQQYSTQTEMSSLSDFDYMFKAMKMDSGKSEERPNGFSDEDITEYLQTQNKISLRKERETAERASQQKRLESIQVSEARKIQKLQDEIKEREITEAPELEKTLNKFMKYPKINGIEFGESDIKDAAEEFRLLNKYDSEGKKPLFDIFMDNENLFKAYMFLRGNGELVKQIFSTIKTDAAKNILSRTSLVPADPNKSFGGAASQIPTVEDFLQQ